MGKGLRLGTWITVTHPTVVDLVAAHDFDWLCVDLEHSPIDRVGLQTAVNIIQGHGRKAFARVSCNRHDMIKFPLDAGIDGIIVPMVNSAAEAKTAVESCLYPPKGNRGVGLGRAQRYGFGFNEHLQQNLKSLEIFVQVEHIQAVEDIDNILAIDAITGVFLGPYDLSGSMGIAGQFDHPKMVAAIKHVSERTLSKGKALGMHVIPPDNRKVQEYADQGYNFIAFSLDTMFMGQKIQDELAKLSPGDSL